MPQKKFETFSPKPSRKKVEDIDKKDVAFIAGEQDDNKFIKLPTDKRIQRTNLSLPDEDYLKLKTAALMERLSLQDLTYHILKTWLNDYK